MAQQTEADVAACWNENAEQWTSDVRNGYDIYRDLFTFPAFLHFLPPLAGLDVVDFGCGEGSNTRRLAMTGARMTGIDISERMIEHALSVEKSDPAGIDYRIASFSSDTNFPASSFGAVVSTMSLMDAPDFQGAMHEAFRLVCPGGFLAFSVIHPCFVTPGLQWQKNEAGQTIGLGVARYFDGASFTEKWTFGGRPGQNEAEPFAVPRFPRTISNYLNAVVTAGFRINRVEEPQPTDSACEAAPRLRRWRDLGAFLLLVMAGKS